MISLTLWSIVAFRLAKLDFCEPVNIGSDEMVGMNEMAEIVHSFENKNIPIKSHSSPFMAEIQTNYTYKRGT